MGLWKTIKDNAVVDRATDEWLHSLALQEMQSGARRDGLWAKALLQAGTNQRQTELAYLRLLVQHLKDEMYVHSRVSEAGEAAARSQATARRAAAERAALLASGQRLCRTLRVKDVDLGSYQILARAAGAALVHEGCLSDWHYVESSRRITFHNYAELRPWFLANVVPKVEAEA